MHDTPQVDVDHEATVGVRHLDERRREEDAGVVEEQEHIAEIPCDALRRLDHLAALGDVGGDRVGAELVRDGRDGVGVDVDEHRAVAVRDGALGERPADAARAPGDHRDPSARADRI